MLSNELLSIFLKKEMIDIIGSIVLPIAAAYITWKFAKIQASINQQQANSAALTAEIARNQLRLDLFDKRFQIFEAANQMIRTIETRRIPTKDECAQYLDSIKAAEWIFDQKVKKYLDDIFSAAFEICNIAENLLTENDKNERINLNNSQSELFKKICIEYKEQLKPLMSPYLQFNSPKFQKA